MVTLEDVAAIAGVSRATVSRVVNGDNKVKALTREKVKRAVAELGYTPTRQPGRWRPAKVTPWAWSPPHTEGLLWRPDGFRPNRSRVQR